VIRKETLEALEERLRRLGVRAEDCIEKFILGSGRGGQKINKTSSCVYLKHVPTGIEIKCQQERSRELNRYYARKALCERLEEQKEGKRSAKQALISKIRRQKQRRSRKSQEKRLADKKTTGQTKALRRQVNSD
jgi:protein subunit release factor B